MDDAGAVAQVSQAEGEPTRRRRGLGRAGLVAAVATALPITGSLLVVAASPFLAVWLRGQGPMGVVWFAVAFALLGAVALAPTYTTSMIAGWAFGFRAGFPAVVFGTVGGATLCYLCARWLAGERVAETYREHPRWEIVRRALLEDAPVKTLWIVFLLRLSPVLPFGTTNILLSTSGVPLPVYVAGTLLGLMPRTGLVALAAASAEQFEAHVPSHWGMLGVGIVAAGLCILIMAVVGKRALERATRTAETA